jgi:hypothetical protein
MAIGLHRQFNDRLLLGLKGTMSEAELHVLRARLTGGIINKARKGELRLPLPVGFVHDGQGRVVLDPDKQVQESVRLLFDTFSRTGAAHATIKYFRTQGLLFPTRVFGGRRKGELTWVPLSLGRIAHVLHSPWYAGAYAYGRARWRKHPTGKIRREYRPPEEWLALIRDAHPGYISCDDYARIQQRLQSSSKAHLEEFEAPLYVSTRPAVVSVAHHCQALLVADLDSDLLAGADVKAVALKWDRLFWGRKRRAPFVVERRVGGVAPGWLVSSRCIGALPAW